MPVMIQALFVGAVFALMACSAAAIESAQRARTTADSPAQPIAMADGLRGYVRNEIYGKGEPIVRLAGAFADSSSMVRKIARCRANGR